MKRGLIFSFIFLGLVAMMALAIGWYQARALVPASANNSAFLGEAIDAKYGDVTRDKTQEADVLGIGFTFCTDLDTAPDPATRLMYGYWHLTVPDPPRPQILKAAIAHLCPRHDDLLEGLPS